MLRGIPVRYWPHATPLTRLHAVDEAARKLMCIISLLSQTQTTADEPAAAQPPEPCDFDKHGCQRPRHVCVGWKAAEAWPRSAGRCLAANVSYVPSYSTEFRSVHPAGSHDQSIDSLSPRLGFLD